MGHRFSYNDWDPPTEKRTDERTHGQKDLRALRIHMCVKMIYVLVIHCTQIQLSIWVVFQRLMIK